MTNQSWDSEQRAHPAPLVHVYGYDFDSWADPDLLVHSSHCYQEGCLNIFSCTLRSVYNALRTRPALGPAARIAGVLWYQGCSDADLQGPVADTYSMALTRCLSCLRDMICAIEAHCRSSPPPATARIVNAVTESDQCVSTNPVTGDRVSASQSLLPIVLVAVTSTRPLPSLDTVRAQQLKSPLFLDGVRVVDAFGALLQADEVHLHAVSALALGCEIAEAMYRLTVNPQTTLSLPPTVPSRTTATDTAMDTGTPRTSMRNAEAGSSTGGGGEALTTSGFPSYFPSTAQSLVRQYNQAVAAADAALHNVYSTHPLGAAADSPHPEDSPLVVDLLGSCSGSGSPSCFPVLRSGCKAANFTSGSVDFSSALSLLHTLAPLFSG